jgi:cystathionine beta-lyase/cystathionine gamma-synthase
MSVLPTSFCDNIDMFSLAESLGIIDGLERDYVGLEDEKNLIRALDKALDQV